MIAASDYTSQRMQCLREHYRMLVAAGSATFRSHAAIANYECSVQHAFTVHNGSLQASSLVITCATASRQGALAWVGCLLSPRVTDRHCPCPQHVGKHRREIGGLQRRTRAEVSVTPSTFLAKVNFQAYPWLDTMFILDYLEASHPIDERQIRRSLLLLHDAHSCGPRCSLCNTRWNLITVKPRSHTLRKLYAEERLDELQTWHR